jgi:protein TonB
MPLANVKRKNRKRRLVPIILGTLLVSGLGAGTLAMVRGILSGAAPVPKKLAQEIRVIRPLPPPPDLPPPPPPPPEEKVDIPDPQQKPDPKPSDDPPPSENLGLDTAGSGAGDSFGLVGHPGGRELIGSGGGSVFAWYGGLVQSEMRDCLNNDEELRKGSNYRVSVQIWIRADGSVDRPHLMKSSGDAKRDRAIEVGAERCRFSRPPPPEVPQPITVRLAG